METILSLYNTVIASPIGGMTTLVILAVFGYGLYRWVKAPRKAKAGGEEHFTGQPPASAAR